MSSGIDPDAPSESASEYDGFLSYAGEYHALAVGALAGGVYAATGDAAVAAGLWAIVTGGRKVSGHLADARDEVAYTAGGAVLGFFLVGVATAFFV